MATIVYNYSAAQTGPVYDLNNYFLIDGNWDYNGTYNGLSQLVSGNGLAIANLLQGVIQNVASSQTIVNPITFGGIAPDNSATAGPQVIQGQYAYTTTMPNSNKPLATHLYDSNSQYMFRIAKVESDGSIWIEDPFGLAVGYTGALLYGACENLNAMTKVVIKGNANFGFTLPGQQPVVVSAQTITLNANTNGIVEPFVIYANDGDVTITITQ